MRLSFAETSTSDLAQNQTILRELTSLNQGWILIQQLIADISLDFLIDCNLCNLCMLNGRLGTHGFTHISTGGKSVVDHVFVPHEQFASFSEFSVQSMSDIMGDYLHDYKSSDHSILLWL